MDIPYLSIYRLDIWAVSTILAIRSNASVNISVQVLVQAQVLNYLWYIPGSGIAGS